MSYLNSAIIHRITDEIRYLFSAYYGPRVQAAETQGFHQVEI